MTGDARDRTLPVGLAMALVFGLLRLRPLGAPDLWWHLGVGRTVLAEKARRFPDVMGIPPKEPFVAGEWGFDVLALGLWNLGGAPALVLFAALTASLSFLLVWLLARRVAGARGAWIALGVAVVVASITTVRFFPRPHILFLVFLPAALLLGWEAARARGRRQLGLLAGLLAVVGLWSQCHPSVIIAPVAVAGVGLPWLVGRRDPGEGHRLSAPLWIALGLCCCAPLATSYGTDVVAHVTGHGTGADSVTHIGEMHPMPADWWWPPRARSILLVEGLVLAGIVGAFRARRLLLGPTGLALFGLLMTLNTHRFRAAWAILLVPLVADALAPRTGRSPGRRTIVAVLALCLLLPLWEAGRGGLLRQGPRLGLDSDWVPVELGDALDRLDVRGPVWGDYDAGGYIGWRRYGHVRVFIDGRTPPFFTGDHFYAARVAPEEPAAFERLHAGYGFTAAVVGQGTALCRWLNDSPDWRAAWRGSTGRRVLFLSPPRGEAVEAPCDQPAK
jgi:hypothetical protein